MQIPNLNNLRAFDAAARHLNFRLAAEELHVTQGAVAQQIRRLERELNQALFLREARGVRLTEAGQRLHPNVRQAIALLQQGLHQLAEATTVTISVPPSFATKWLLPRLPQLASDLPDITLSIRAEEKVIDLEQGVADLAIRMGAAPQEVGIDRVELAPLRLVAVARDGLYPTVRTLGDLVDLPLIQDGHRDWQTLLSAAGLQAAQPMLQVNQTALAMDAATQGQGIALVPDIYLGPGATTLPSLLTPIWQPQPTTTAGFHLVWSRRRERVEIERVRNWLRAQAAAAS